ncbi:clustered mitochondria protein [Quercus suber]|uniref:Clustered mitochondria protein n=1 Tax=Quercus suber TaxID=58331 RepID=A0AAW0IT88_QUESU
MAGKSNKGKNRRGAHNTTNSSESVVSSDAPAKDNLSASESTKADANGVPTVDVTTNVVPEVKESESENAAGQQKQGEGDIHLYPVSVKTQSGEKLELQYETTQNKASSPGDTAKTEVPELDGLGFMEDVAGSLNNLLSSSSTEIKCVESIVFSSFNPPPSYRRLVGDLIYLDVVTLEGNKFCITGTTKMFYVNSSPGNTLDPRPSKTSSEATTLVGLLQKISSKFKKAFREILERRASAHPFENVQSLLPPNSWLGSYPVPEHKRDAARAEDALTLSYGSELIGMQRDWNEELQSCREFPHTTPQERILRDRALYKVTSDFVDAAISGAIGVISRCIPPINPTDPECFHMYVHNNIFFSFAVDADLEQLSKKRSLNANSNIENSSLSNSSSDKASSLLHGDSGIPNGEKCEPKITGEGDNVVEVPSNVSAETQLTESEQATYASANNDLKGTKAYQEADVSGLYNLAMAIIDYRGHRVVAQLPEDARSRVMKVSVIRNLCQKDVTKEGRDENVKDCASSQAETEPHEDILFNPNEIAEDEENVRKVSSYLTNIVLPKFVQDLCTLEVSPMDGQTLTEALHAHGINVRYIGKVADGTKHLPHLWDLCSNEIVVRSAKHILKDVLRDIEDHDIAPAISHFFNCFFGSIQAVGSKVAANNMQSRTHKKDQGGHQSSGKPSKGQGRFKGGASARKNQLSFMNVSSETLWSDIKEFAKLKYQFELPEDARSRVKKVSVIRNLCQKVGITIAARKYDFNSVAPFQTSDIMNLQPVVKHSVPLCSEAKDLVETGKIQLAEGMLSEAYTLFSEAFSILQQVTGPMHREVANCCRYLAMVLYHAGDMAGAIMQQHKELIINERYGNMALFYHGLNQTELALRHMSRALLLLSLSSGPDHPDVAATFINVAMMYQDIGNMNTALRYLQEALKKNERLLGEEHIQTAVCYHALAIAFNCMGAFKLSHQHEKKTYDILVKQLGEEDSRTRDSQNWMKTFKMRELQMNAQKQKGQALNAASAQKAIDILKAHPDLIQAFQAAATAGGSGSSGTSVNKSLNAAIISDNPPRGRGVDERAARAAAEVRKKAAARGLLIRPHGVPVQAMPPLTQLLNIINSGMTPDAAEGGETDGVKKEANGHPSNSPVDSKNDELTSGQEDQAPVGLGTGLASLDAKKQKAKAKAAA